MSWIDELEMQEKYIKERFQHEWQEEKLEHLEIQELLPAIKSYRDALDSHCRGLDPDKETALRYTVRLRLPLLNHLYGVSLSGREHTSG